MRTALMILLSLLFVGCAGVQTVPPTASAEHKCGPDCKEEKVQCQSESRDPASDEQADAWHDSVFGMFQLNRPLR